MQISKADRILHKAGIMYMILFILSFFIDVKVLIELNMIESEIRMLYKINKSMVTEFPNIPKVTKLSQTVLN